MDEKIVATIKLALGLSEDYTPFDIELIMHINSIAATLTQLGVGPIDGLEIDADTPWSALLQDKAKLQSARSYIALRLKMLFDSSNMTAHVVAAHEKMITEHEWRLQVAADPMIPQKLPIEEEVI